LEKAAIGLNALLVVVLREAMAVTGGAAVFLGAMDVDPPLFAAAEDQPPGRSPNPAACRTMLIDTPAQQEAMRHGTAASLLRNRRILGRLARFWRPCSRWQQLRIARLS
jgi:hypothetical protein